MNRVNIIKRKTDQAEFDKWRKVTNQFGQHENSMAEYCNFHAKMLVDRQQAAVFNEPSNFDELPFILNIIGKGLTENINRIEVISSPLYEVLIGNEKYVDTVETIMAEFEFPYNIQYMADDTNLLDIYQERMLENFSSTLKNYINSIPNVNTIVVLSFGEIIFLDQTTLSATNSTIIKCRFRLKAFDDATYLPNKEVKIKQSLGNLSLKGKQTKNIWIAELNKEPNFLIRIFAKLLGIKFNKK